MTNTYVLIGAIIMIVVVVLFIYALRRIEKQRAHYDRVFREKEVELAAKDRDLTKLTFSRDQNEKALNELSAHHSALRRENEQMRTAYDHLARK